METKKAPGLFAWLPQWATVTATTLIVLIAGGSGVVAASASSLPDETLYQVKLATEQARLVFTPSILGKAELYIKLADKRVAEIAEMAKEGKGEEVEQTAERLNEHLVAMANIAGPPPPAPAMLQAPAPRAPQQEQTEGGEPEIVTRSAESGPEVKMEQAPQEKPVMAPASPEAAPAPMAGGAGDESAPAESDRYLEVRIALAQSARENPQLLEAILDSVPDETRPALLRAIELSRQGYQQALGALSE